MKKTFIYLITLCLVGSAFSQVKDISVTGTPIVNYTWWDKHSPIANTMNVGGQLGFGFGQGIELKAVYQKALGAKTQLSRLTTDNVILSGFTAKELTISQWGGEFKGNIPLSSYISPYLTLGTGIQNIKVNDTSHDQIYASAGLGTKFNITNRIVFNLEGKASVFNLNPSYLLISSSTETTPTNEWINQNVTLTRMINYSLQAGVQFYLGGQTPEKMTAIEKAYQRSFSGGLKGFKLIVEPQMGYINFDADTKMKNTYLLGASTGFDFTEFVGVRGFYYQSVTDKSFSSADKMALYGADFTARLNVARGVVPSLIIGGGYMNIYNSYVGTDNATGLSSGYFAKGGIGLNIPVSKHIEIFGSANAILTTHKSDQTILKDQLFTSYMYNGGIRIKIGSAVNAQKQLDSWINEQTEAYQKQLEEKQERIAQLEEEIKRAYKENNAEKAVEIINEKKTIEEQLSKTNKKSENTVYLSTEELQALIAQTIKEVDNAIQKQTIEQRVSQLEQQRSPTHLQATAAVNTNIQQQILNQIQQLNSKIDQNTARIEHLKNNQEEQTLIISQKDHQIYTTENRKVAKQIIFLRDYSVFLGGSLGQVSTGVIGLRVNYSFSKTKLEFTPDILFGFSGKKVFGVNTNVILPFQWENKYFVKPYIGTGLGLNKFADNIEFGPNLIIGTSFNVLGGKVSADYTSRNFKNHQIAIGYRFNL